MKLLWSLLAAVMLAGTAHAQDAIVVTPAAEGVPLGRLSEAVKPAAYRLDLTVDPAKPRFSGHVEIDATLAAPASTIDLHGRGLAVSRLVASAGGRSFPGQWREVDPGGVARVTFAQDLPAGPVTLAFDYDAAFADGPSGMFRLEVESGWYSWTHFQPINARAVFPCFDQPGFKTPFTLTLRTPQGLTAIGNAPEAGVPGIENGLAVHRFAPTAPLPTYLVAMMVGPFATLSGDAAPNAERSPPLPVRIASTSPNAGELAFALDGSQRITALLEDYFGEPFPFPKLDQITTPILPGAMENAAASLYRDDLVVMDGQAPVVQQRSFGTVVAHELGHQWFGDLVTPAWWDDLWLNESFANWIGYRVGEQWRPDLGIAGDALGAGYEAMETDALLAGRPIRQPIARSSDIDSAFDAITYGKGGHVVGMIAAWLGDEKFREGVRRHIAAHRFGSATSEDFFAALAEVAGNPKLVPAMRSFVEQQGVPLLAMKQSGDRVAVTQLRYTTAGVAPPESDWTIPLCLRRGANRQCFIMDQHTQSFVMAGKGPVFPNAGGTGYYRFELTAKHWQDLIASADTLPGGEALALVDSLWASIRGGRGTIGEMARLAKKLIHHPDPHAADAPDKALSRLVRENIVGAQGRRGFRLLREKLYLPLLKTYGFDPHAGIYAQETSARAQRRVQVINALVGTESGKNIRRKLQDAVAAYLAGDRTALDPAWFDHALDIHLFGQDAAAVHKLVDQALSSQDPVFRPAALGAAARFGDPAVAAWLLSLDDPRLRDGEKRDFLDGVMSRSTTREYGYAWALAQVDVLLAGSNGASFARRLPQMLGRFCSVAWGARIERDFGPKLAGTPGALELARASERVRNCGLLDDMMGPQIDAEFAAMR
ncbi:M1 family metallopeptidase [Novosphingobium sp. AP12]|uniref:M1 family metallopeptidase n=1 Tax=Novosphingobium sp. AP12 TaxID=1144305 RepID=UPI0002721489|nr:M1 family metallopeptidase [Novosphingobium sp. AP12]EJL33860.1 aminopeptidase N [Novosphingobium sp. AP12]